MQYHNNNNCSFVKKFDNISLCPILGLQPHESSHIGFQYNKVFSKNLPEN